MSITRINRALALLAIALAAGIHMFAAGDDTLAHAKGLYASAAYDEALAVLDRLQTSEPVEDPTAIAEYRVFCLLALERGDEARKNIDRILRDNPLYLPSADQVSPRIQNVFRDVRRQSLPKIVMERYAAAKAAFERKDPRAGQQFENVVALLNDPDIQGASALADLRDVASAFLDLTKAQAMSESAPPAPDGRRGEQPGVQPTPAADVIYTAADSDVVPPVAQTQTMPPWRPLRDEVVKEFVGALRLLIDKNGAVVAASMATSIRPSYDQLLLRAAREWKFSPARKQGVPVRYLKVIGIRLRATS